MNRKPLIRNSLVAIAIFTAIALLDELDYPWAKAAVGYVSRALHLEVDFRAVWSAAQGYLSGELEAAWPDLVDAGIVTEKDSADAERPGGGDGRPQSAAPLTLPIGWDATGGSGAVSGSDRAADAGQATGAGSTTDLGEPATREAPSQPPSRAPLPVQPAGEARGGTQQVRTPSEGLAVPVRGTLVYGFGWRVHPIYRKRLFHDGIDIAADRGTPVVSALDGRVTAAGNMGTYGLAVEVAHSSGISTLYAHCSRVLVREGQKVARGQKIGEVGSTGLSTGPHLHFEVRRNGNPVDPLGYIKRERIEGR